MRTLFLLAVCLAACSAQTIAEKTQKLQKMPGYFPLYYDGKTGHLLLEISRWNDDFLYVFSLPAGVGSNDLGLDRGRIGGEAIVHFERVGPKVLLIQPNQEYRAISSDPAERRAVEQSFAQSVLGGFTVEAEEDGRVLVDATAFFLRDANQIPETVQFQKQGDFSLDPARSALYLEHTKSFPRNTEVEATLTFSGKRPGAWVRSVVPTPEAMTVREHHSFIQLPDPGYQPRAYDPRSGFFGIQFLDYATPISEPIHKRFIERHRLEKRDPRAAVSDAVKPIVYYLDPGVPEPIRSALMDGAKWWAQAFEAAGFRNAWRVEMLPTDADPMDIRYNLIQWVHRSTRGWSYGATISDPRTGEIIKGQVSLGSLRVRQDFLIAEGLIAKYEQGQPVDPRMEQMALARLRQLAAHEVGHTLGLQHNFAASTHDRASVMDYPPPAIALNAAGNIDLSNAYATGIGDWDKVAIRWGYSQFGSAGDNKGALDQILNEAHARGLRYITDRDSRPAGGASPIGHLWDNGANPIDELNRLMKVRAKALADFSESKIRFGFPLRNLEEVLVPVYLVHRYQVEAVSKIVGGLNYSYAVRGGPEEMAEIVAPAEQRRALEALLQTLTPAALTVPERILKLLPPNPPGYESTREDFHSRTRITFDSLAPVEAAADMPIGMLLNPERATRLVEYHGRDSRNPGLDEVIDRLIQATWKSGDTSEVAHTIDNVVLYRLMALAQNNGASEQVRAIAFLKLDELKKWSLQMAPEGVGQQAHLRFAAAQIERFQRDPEKISVTKPADPPDGQPI